MAAMALLLSGRGARRSSSRAPGALSPATSYQGLLDGREAGGEARGDLAERHAGVKVERLPLHVAEESECRENESDERDHESRAVGASRRPGTPAPDRPDGPWPRRALAPWR